MGTSKNLCDPGYKFDGGQCKKICVSSPDSVCLSGLCSKSAWICDDDQNKNGKVCKSVDTIPEGKKVYPSLKECLTTGDCSCSANWEWNADMDSCNTYACPLNAENGWGSNIKKGQLGTKSTLFDPYPTSGGICLPVSSDGTISPPNASCSGTDKKSCINTGSDPNKLSCRWFPNNKCLRKTPNMPPGYEIWDVCTCNAFDCIGDCDQKDPLGGYTLDQCHNEGFGCLSKMHVNDQVISNCALKYKKLSGKTDDPDFCPKDQPYNPVEFNYCQLTNGDFEWVQQGFNVTHDGKGPNIYTDGINQGGHASWDTEWCSYT